MQIVLESLNLMPPDADYKEMRDATLTIVDDEFGPCSDEGTAVRMAWNQICVGTSTCGFYIAGPNEVCEEDDYLHLFVSGGLPGAPFRWYFPLGWTVEGNPVGNYIEGPSLTVNDFPKYNWYPRYFQIMVVMLGTGEERTKTIKLVDCLHDDPTCEEYNAIRGNPTPGRISSNETAVEADDHSAASLKVFDLMGRPLYSGVATGFNGNIIPSHNNGMVIFIYFAENGTLIKTEKRILTR